MLEPSPPRLHPLAGNLPFHHRSTREGGNSHQFYNLVRLDLRISHTHCRWPQRWRTHTIWTQSARRYTLCTSLLMTMGVWKSSKSMNSTTPSFIQPFIRRLRRQAPASSFLRVQPDEEIRSHAHNSDEGRCLQNVQYSCGFIRAKCTSQWNSILLYVTTLPTM